MFLQEMGKLQGQLSGEGGEDPLIALKRLEIENRAKIDQERVKIDQQRLGLDQNKAQQANMFNQERLKLQQMKLVQPQGGLNAA